MYTAPGKPTRPLPATARRAGRLSRLALLPLHLPVKQTHHPVGKKRLDSAFEIFVLEPLRDMGAEFSDDVQLRIEHEDNDASVVPVVEPEGEKIIGKGLKIDRPPVGPPQVESLFHLDRGIDPVPDGDGLPARPENPEFPLDLLFFAHPFRHPLPPRTAARYMFICTLRLPGVCS